MVTREVRERENDCFLRLPKEGIRERDIEGKIDSFALGLQEVREIRVLIHFDRERG